MGNGEWEGEKSGRRKEKGEGERRKEKGERRRRKEEGEMRKEKGQRRKGEKREKGVHTQKSALSTSISGLTRVSVKKVTNCLIWILEGFHINSPTLASSFSDVSSVLDSKKDLSEGKRRQN
jgi:hypothetical protein